MKLFKILAGVTVAVLAAIGLAAAVFVALLSAGAK